MPHILILLLTFLFRITLRFLVLRFRNIRRRIFKGISLLTANRLSFLLFIWRLDLLQFGSRIGSDVVQRGVALRFSHRVASGLSYGNLLVCKQRIQLVLSEVEHHWLAD